MTNVVIIGRPNVGKSSLFNKIATSQRAITHNYAGTTRDYKTAEAKLGDIEFTIIDTAGMCFGKNLSALEKSINAQTDMAISKADVILFVVDGKEGLKTDDINIDRFIRKKNLRIPIMLVINKLDHKAILQNLNDFFELNYKDMCQTSAEHSIGLNNIYEYLRENMLKASEYSDLNTLKERKKIKIAIIGRPNVGKSTIINALMQENRVVTGSEPGTTRDSISVDLIYKDVSIELVDTAGLRKKRNVDRYGLEKLSVNKTVSTIEIADVVLLAIDVGTLLESQDLKIASLAIEHGKPSNLSGEQDRHS